MSASCSTGPGLTRETILAQAKDYEEQLIGTPMKNATAGKKTVATPTTKEGPSSLPTPAPPIRPSALLSAITPQSYPAVWEAIAAHASVSTAMALRATCTQLRSIVDASLLTHLVVEGPTCTESAKGYGKPVRKSGGFERGVFLAPRDDGAIRVRVPPIRTSNRAMSLRRRCLVLDVDGTIYAASSAWLARLLAPHSLRVPSANAEQAFQFDTVSSAFHHFCAKVIIVGPSRCASAPSAKYMIRDVNGRILPDRLGFTFRRPIHLSDSTTRLVLHKEAHIVDCSYDVVQGAGNLREVVLVMHPCGRSASSSSDAKAHDNLPPCPKPSPATVLAGYVLKFVTTLPSPDIAVTMVGLEAACKDALEQVREGLDVDGRLESGSVVFRTMKEHRAAMSAAQWALEMEI